MPCASAFNNRRFRGQPEVETMPCLDAVGRPVMGKWRCRRSKLDRRGRGALAADPVFEFHDVYLPTDASGSAKSLSVTGSLRKRPGDMFDIGSPSPNCERGVLIVAEEKPTVPAV